jgi:radical SAM protein with 4Fe4S-binding SPASM domain
MHMIAWGSVGNEGMGAVHEKERCNRYLAEAQDRARARGIPLVAPQPFALTPPKEACANGTASKCTVAPASRELVESKENRSKAFGLDTNGKPSSVCPFPWSFVAIDMRGNVVPCGWWRSPDQEMGNIYVEDFLSIWRSERYVALRNRHLEGVLTGSCAKCSAAGMGSPDAEYSFSPR